MPRFDGLERRAVLSSMSVSSLVHPLAGKGLTRQQMLAAIEGLYDNWSGTVSTKISGNQVLRFPALLLFDPAPQVTPQAKGQPALPPVYVTIRQPPSYTYSPFPTTFQVKVSFKGQRLTFQQNLKAQGLKFHIDGVQKGETITGNITVTGPNRALKQTFSITRAKSGAGNLPFGGS